MAIDLVALSALANEPTITEMVTLFVYREDWLADEECIDWRIGNQLIPRGAFVIGLINPNNGMGIVNIPFLSDTQKHQLNRVVKVALVRVGVYPFEAPVAADALIEGGCIRFAKKDSLVEPIEEKVFQLRD